MIKELTRGDSYFWVVPPFTASDGTQLDALNADLTVFFVGPVKSSVTAKKEFDKWKVVIDPVTSEKLTPGLYAVSYRFTRSDFRQTIRIGRFQVLPSIDDAEDGHDPRTLAEKALEESEKALAKYNASGQRVQSYTINGRSMTFSSAAEILGIIEYWRRRVQAEKGRGKPQILWINFR